jgi:SEC-C motif-containing protein
LVDDLVDILTSTDRFWVTAADVIWRVDLLLDGVVLTHRLSEREVADGAIEICPDTEMIDFDIDRDEDLLIDGQVAAIDFDLAAGWHVWSLPDGLPSGVVAGDLIGLRRRGGGITIEHGEEFAASVEAAAGNAHEKALLAALAETLTQAGARGIGLEATQIVMEVLADPPDQPDESGQPGLLRTATVPLTELLKAAGASRKGDFFGPGDVDWEMPGARLARQMREDLFRRWRFDDCCEKAFELVHESWTAHVTAAPPPHEAGEVRGALAHGAVSLAFFEFVGEMADLDRWETWLKPLTDTVRRDAAPALHLLGLALERAGRVVAAEGSFEKASLADAEFSPPFESLGVLAFERGDLSRAISLLGRASPPDRPHPMIEMIEYLSPPMVEVGRNEPCPCGSGRKFKVCHRGKPFDADGETAAAKLLLHKATTHLHRRESQVHENLLWSLDDDAIERLEYDGLVGDIALFEAGVFERFLAARTEVLPVAEVVEGRRWLDTPRRLFEVVGVEPGEWLDLLDATSGETHHVVEHSGSVGVDTGEYLLVRVVVPDAASGGGPAAIGVVTKVPMRARESLLEVLDDGADPHALVHWWSRVTAPAELRNRHGHELVFCELSIDSGADEGDTRAALDALWGADSPAGTAADGAGAGGVDGRDTWHWNEPALEDSDELLIAARIELVDGRLEASTNSVERADELLVELGAVLPEMRLVTDVRTPLDEFPHDGGGEGDVEGSGMIDPAEAPPEVQEAMRAYMREFEESWLDEALPALDGMTPREAVVDPTRRGDVERILADFAPRDDGFGMDPQRIRDLLGLD